METDRLRVLIDEFLGEWTEAQLMQTTLRDVLVQYNFTEKFQHRVLVPCLQTYVATSKSTVDMPVGFFIYFEKHFGLCLTGSRVNGRRVKEGSSEYIRRLKELLVTPDETAEGNTVDVRVGSGATVYGPL